MAKRTVKHADAELYESDYHAWVQRQVELLRAERFADLDLPNLIEEVEDLAKRDLKEAESRTRAIVHHLLKLAYSPARDPRRGWRRTVLTQRIELGRHLTPTLRRILAEALDELHEEARLIAVDDVAEDGVVAVELPRRCPYTLEQILDLDWLPENVHGLRDDSKGGAR